MDTQTQNFTHEYSSTPAFMTLDDIKNKKVTVMGLGLNGGGEACVRFLLKHGAFVTVTDMKTEEQLAPTIKKLSSDTTLPQEKIRYVLGRHEISDFEQADVIIKNPGVKYSGNKYLAAAKNIETDLSIFLHFTKAPIIAVTGSKGKSSTVSAIHYGLCKAGFNAFLGGNITVSPLTFIEKTNENTPVVLELSSWQLSDLRGRKLLKPKIALITKIVPDHQNWYGSMEAYVADKKLIYADQDHEDFSIFDGNDSWGKIFASESKGTVLFYSEKDSFYNKKDFLGCYIDKKNYGRIKTSNNSEPLLALESLAVPGKHMRENILNAALVMNLMKIPADKIKEILKTFPGIEHRLEFFHEWKNKNGITFAFYNDSAATVPEATGAAIEAFEIKPIMICGGTDKNLEFTTLAKSAKKALKLFLLAGSGTDKLTDILDSYKIKYEKPAINLEELFFKLKYYLDSLLEEPQAFSDSQSKQSSIDKKDFSNKIPVVFSPGATSFGMFNNEFDRGVQYKNGIKKTFND
ncbi:MAG: UDP-N-acetylmuramoyl-L-alanine--D-glutamate ligase [Treponemataceae bacterium]